MDQTTITPNITPPVSAPVVPTPAPEPTDPPVEHHKSFTWLIVSLLTLILVVAGFLFWQDQKLHNEIVKVDNSKSANQTGNGPDEFGSWQEYSANDLGFSFLYPTNMTIKNDTLKIDSAVEFDKFIFFVQKTNDSLVDYVNKLKDSNAIAPKEGTTGLFPTVEWIGSYKNMPAHYLSTLNQGYVYSILIAPTVDSTQFNQEESTLLDQIVSTFGFTANNLSDVSSWRTYSENGRFFFSFKYPPGGQLTTGDNPSQLEIVRIAYADKQIEWMIQENNENLPLLEYVKKFGGQYPGLQVPLSKLRGSVETDKQIGQLTGVYIIFPEAASNSQDASGTSIHFYTENKQHGNLVHWIRLSSNNPTLTASDYQLFENLVKSATLN